MSRKTRGRIRMLFAIPSTAVLVFGATELLASPAPSARLPDCAEFCQDNPGYCTQYPNSYICSKCGGCLVWGR